MSEIGSLLGAVITGRDPGEYGKCPRCKRHDFLGVHRCPPAFYCFRDDDDPGDEREVFASSAENAANEFVEQNFSNWDYPTSVTVIVRDYRSNLEYKFEVEVEAVPSFYAGEIEHHPIEAEEETEEDSGE